MLEHFADLSTSLGGTLKPLKKTVRFRNWVSSTGRRARYVVVTDWREAKPCLQAISELQPLLASPTLLVALYEQEGKGNHLGKARKWALGSSGPAGSACDVRVEVVESIQEASALVSEFCSAIDDRSLPSAEGDRNKESCDAHRAPKGKYKVDSAGRVDDADQWDKADKVVHKMPEADKLDRSGRVDEADEVDKVRADKVGMVPRADALDGLSMLDRKSDEPLESPPESPASAPLQEQLSPFDKAQAGGMPAAVLSMLWRVCPSGNSVELQEMLNAAVPSEYND